MKASVLVLLVVAVGLGTAQDHFSIEDFTKSPTEHVINRIDAPFTVRSIRGIIISTGVREHFQGLLFELQGPGSDRTIRKAVTDENGQFMIKHVRAGAYHFKATRNGWQSVIGTIAVSKRADKHNRIKLNMRLGV